MSQLMQGDTVQVVVNAPPRHHPLARGVLKRSRVVTDDETLASVGGRSVVMWTVETSEGSTFEVPEVYLAKVEEE